jgi:hypothetical protein
MDQGQGLPKPQSSDPNPLGPEGPDEHEMEGPRLSLYVDMSYESTEVLLCQRRLCHVIGQ